MVVSAGLLQASLVHAAPGALISAEQVAADQAAAAASAASPAHAQLHAALDREDLVAKLAAHGVPVDALRSRVDALTDAEAVALVARIDTAPAGAGIVSTLFTVFVILLVTDILGFTKVFPFTRPVR
jgi:hypothetical protein